MAEITAPLPQFDRVAPLYRAMEILSFGPMLERCRFHHLSRLAHARRALILGDGDGRFLARLFSAAPNLRADAVDGSPAMLALLRKRVSRLGAEGRLTTTCADARCLRPQSRGYDLVVTHFFLDCLTEAEADRLIARLRMHLIPGGQWLVSEFQIPAGSRLRAGLARGVIATLYAGFRLLTGLTVRKIPPWPALLARHGFTPKASHSWLGGLLVSEVWELREATAPIPPALPPEVIPTTVLDQLDSVPGIDPGPEPTPGPPPVPRPDPAPGPPPDPDPEPYPGPLPAPQPIT